MYDWMWQGGAVQGGAGHALGPGCDRLVVNPDNASIGGVQAGPQRISGLGRFDLQFFQYPAAPDTEIGDQSTSIIRVYNQAITTHPTVN